MAFGRCVECSVRYYDDDDLPSGCIDLLLVQESRYSSQLA